MDVPSPGRAIGALLEVREKGAEVVGCAAEPREWL